MINIQTFKAMAEATAYCPPPRLRRGFHQRGPCGRHKPHPSSELTLPNHHSKDHDDQATRVLYWIPGQSPGWRRIRCFGRRRYIPQDRNPALRVPPLPLFKWDHYWSYRSASSAFHSLFCGFPLFSVFFSVPFFSTHRAPLRPGIAILLDIMGKIDLKE